MPSLDEAAGRHVVIHRRAGRYLCFPDVCLADGGTLLCAYNDFDRHVATSRRLLLKKSRDGGATWGRARVLRADDSHCPRLSRLPGGRIALLDDAGPMLLVSADQGRRWKGNGCHGLSHGLLDRPQELGPHALFTAGHLHRGSQRRHKIRQAPTEQLAFMSRDGGRVWEAFSVMAAERCLVLCEASVLRLPGEPGAPARLLALMRENSFVGEPMHWCLSEDGGANWSEPRPAPLIGHRPTLGWTASGRLLVTYRDVGPDPGTKAWLGGLDELCADFAVHGLHPRPGNPSLTPEGLLVQSPEGPEAPVRYSLRPLTDPERARADFEAKVLVRQAGEDGCGIRLGLWWRLLPEGLQPDLDGAAFIPWTPGEFHSVRIAYEPGLCTLFVDGKDCGAYPVDPLDADSRPILAGAVSRRANNACEALWRRMSLSISEPAYGREYAWSWHHGQGHPDAWTRARVLELQNARGAAPLDFGYSGWAETAPGRFFCAYHHADGRARGYAPGEHAHVMGTWFTEDDFGAQP